MALNGSCYVLGILVIFSLTDTITCHEKTLRKIVRSQSKMVQRPFDDMIGALSWKNVPHHQQLRLQEPIYAQVKTMYNRMHRPKVSSTLTAMKTGLMKPYSKTKAAPAEKVLPIELRMTRNTFPNVTMTAKRKKILPENYLQNASHPADIIVEKYHKIPSSRFFPPIDENGSQSIEPRPSSKESSSVNIPDKPKQIVKNASVQIKGFLGSNVPKTVKPDGHGLIIKHSPEKTNTAESKETVDDKVDFIIEDGTPTHLHALENKTSTVSKSCTNIKTIRTDIDAQTKFSEFDIEEPWITKTHYWNNIFNSRYEALMRSQKWPPLKVILVPRVHVDSIWKKTFEQYHNNSVHKILSNVVKKLQFYSNLTFTWSEVSHLSRWWKDTSQRSRSVFRQLLKKGRLELTTGCWVETDEATTHIFGLVHQLIEGHQWLWNNLNYSPKVAWLTNTVTHSPTMAYLLSSLGISNLVFTNIHYSWEKYLAEYQISDFIWLQNWISQESPLTSNLNKVLKRLGKDRYPRHAIFAHYLQFNSDGFKACGPNKNMCATEFNFATPSRNMDIHSYNVKEKSELLLEQYSKTGTISPHNVIIAPIGGPHHFELQPEFDYQYNNYLKIADYVNGNCNIYKTTIDFGTPSDYFTAVVQRKVDYPSLKGDFTNFADVDEGSPAYWVGFFTSRPFLKIMLRRLESTLRSTEIIFTLAVSVNSFQRYKISDILNLLIKCREAVAQLSDRNVISGTVTANNLRYVYDKILLTAKDCWHIQEVAVSLLSTKKAIDKPYVQKYVYRDGEFISIFRTINPGDHIFVFNSLSQERPEVVELYTRTPNIRIVDHNKKDVLVQVNPVWKYNSENIIVISRTLFKVTFAITIPPLTLELFKVKETYATLENVASLYCMSCVMEDITNNEAVPFNIHPIQTGDIQLESYKHRLVFDEYSGFLKAIIEKETNVERTLALDYGAFRSSDKNSGTFLFNTNVTKPLHDILKPYRVGKKSKTLIIVTGQITTELTSVYGRLLQNSVRIFNLINSPLSNAIYIESKADYDLSPKNRDLELFMSIQTDIANGNPPEIYTDNNGFQFTARVLNMSRRVESNMYPMTTMSYIQDRTHRLTFITDHAQGVTALQEGQLVVMLDRRVLFDDGRGTSEGLADSIATYHRHYILLENFMEPPVNFDPTSSLNNYQLPSFRAHFLSNTLSYILDIFIVNKDQTDRCHYTYIPLIKAALPCDVALLNYRLIVGSDNLNKLYPNTALLILHRQSFSCRINYEVLINCDLDTRFTIDDILRGVKLVYQTNLVGTEKGIQLNTINLVNFPAMELLTLRIVF